MRRATKLLGAAIGIAGAVLAAVVLSPAMVSGTVGSALEPSRGHRPLHIGCPPGNHGKPRYSGVGEALQRARSLQAGTDDDLAARSLTAGHPLAPVRGAPPR